MSKIARTIIQFTYDIEDFIYTIKSKIEKLSYEEFINSEETIDAVELRLIKIGEAVKQIQNLNNDILYKAYNDKSYWEQVKGTRNRLVHEYWGVSLEMLYYISTQELDELLENILKIRQLEEEK